MADVPTKFEHYLAQWEAEITPDRREPDRERCTGCLEGAPITSDGYCAECMRYRFGYDQAEEKVALAMLGGAVTAALDAYVESEVIVRAVHRAIEGHHEREVTAMVEGLGARA